MVWLSGGNKAIATGVVVLNPNYRKNTEEKCISNYFGL